MRILVLGEIFGKPGRLGTLCALPSLKERHEPDFIMVNAENIAHGVGINKDSITQMQEAGVDFFTLGNHAFDNQLGTELIAQKSNPIVRPANFAPSVPGKGYGIVNVGPYKLMIVNLMGRVEMKQRLDCPFRTMDRILEETKSENVNTTIVDFHAEATSEKAAFGLHFDGKISAMVGTHTHVPTQDARILPHGTAFVSDIGMTGVQNSIIGLDPEGPIQNFYDQLPFRPAVAEASQIMVNALSLEIDGTTGKALKIEKIYESVDI